MKKIINAIRDFIYNITDYGLIIAVVVIMVSVLVWRFDILFSRNIEKEVIAVNPGTDNVDSKTANGSDKDKDNPTNIAEKPGDEKNDTTGKDATNSGTSTNNSGSSSNGISNVIATIEIPQGSFPTKIGEILVNSNVIEDKNAFLNRSVEMGLDTKLQSGTFEIALGTSLDEVIKIIAKAN